MVVQEVVLRASIELAFCSPKENLSFLSIGDEAQKRLSLRQEKTLLWQDLDPEALNSL